MIFYIFKKTLKALPVFFGVSLLLFILFHVAGGDPVYQILGRHASLEEVSSLRHTLGLDQSYSVQFLSFIKQMITLDFGRSYFTQEKIIKIISSHTSPTFMLMVPSYVLTTFFSLSFCLSLAYAKERWPHHTLIHRLGQGLIFMSIVGMCIPLLAYIFIWSVRACIPLQSFSHFWIRGSVARLFTIGCSACFTVCVCEPGI